MIGELPWRVPPCSLLVRAGSVETSTVPSGPRRRRCRVGYYSACCAAAAPVLCCCCVTNELSVRQSVCPGVREGEGGGSPSSHTGLAATASGRGFHEVGLSTFLSLRLPGTWSCHADPSCVVSASPHSGQCVLLLTIRSIDLPVAVTLH